ncbi:MAG: hypothetical protein ABIZ04_15950 [Opitutus sp.]
MKTLLLSFLVGLAAVAPAWASNPTDQGSKNRPAGGDSAPAKLVVHMGMTPDAVAKLIGQPAKVEPVKTPAGDGFRWVYRRLKKEWMDETAVTVNRVPSFVGLATPNQGIGEASMPAHQLERFRVFQVSSLLFVNGKLVGSTQWPETERSFQH